MSGTQPQRPRPEVLGFLDAIKEALQEQKNIEVRGFGTFKIRQRKTRMARNPRTGAPVEVSARPALPKTRARNANGLRSRPIESDMSVDVRKGLKRAVSLDTFNNPNVPPPERGESAGGAAQSAS